MMLSMFVVPTTPSDVTGASVFENVTVTDGFGSSGDDDHGLSADGISAPPELDTMFTMFSGDIISSHCVLVVTGAPVVVSVEK